jgi:hypothetical protein
VKKVFSILFALVLVMSLGLATATPVLASTIRNVPGTYSTIQAAINASVSGDTIMVAAGEYDAFVVQEKTNISIIGAEGATVTTAEVFSIDVWPIEDAWVMAAVYDSENIDIEGINFDGTDIVDEEVVVGIAYVDSTGSIADLAVENIIGADLAAGIVVIGDLGTSTVDLSGVTVANSMSGVAIWNAEVDLNGCTVTETDAGIVIGYPLAEFDPSTVNIQGSTISNNDLEGIYVCDDSIVEAHFNNIVGNTEHGVLNDGGETVDAIYNWWGDASGPYHPIANSGGEGDPVSDDVEFEPWLGAQSVTETVTDVIDYCVDAKDEAGTEVWVTGTARVTIAKYASNPHPEAPVVYGALASFDPLAQDELKEVNIFRDVCITHTTPGTETEIRLYYTDAEVTAANVTEDSLRLFWKNNDNKWVQCSITDVETASTNGYSGYIWARITDTTTPSLTDDLGETPFGGYGHPPGTPTQGCFIATAAYGTDTAREIDILREFRDEVLLPDRLGAEFVSLYYRISPPIANLISQHQVLRTTVRVGFVDPIVKILNWTHDLWST